MTEFLTAGDRTITVDPDKDVIVSILPDVRRFAEKIARARHENKQPGDRDYQRLDPSDPYMEDKQGTLAEAVFCRWLGAKFDSEIKRAGDGGKDTTLRNGETVNIASANRPNHLFLRADRNSNHWTDADILVLASPSKDGQSILFLGWEHREVLRARPVQVFDHRLGFHNHYLSRNWLRPMNLLRRKNGRCSCIRDVDGWDGRYCGGCDWV